MKPVQFALLTLVGLGITAQSVSAASISTRVKVVEDKIRLHDKKLRELAAQQALTNKEIALLKQAQQDAEKAIAEQKANEATQAKVVAAQAVKRKKVVRTTTATKAVAKQETAKKVVSYKDPDTYAYP